MPRVSHELGIQVPPASLFAFLADFSNDAKWRANVLEMKPLGRPEDRGGIWSRHVEVRRVPGRTIETEAVVTAAEPGRRLSIQRATGAIRPEATYQLEESDGGTRLRFDLSITLHGATWLAFPGIWVFMNAAIRPNLPKDFARLKQLLEAQ
jgi:hypothetical protein